MKFEFQINDVQIMFEYVHVPNIAYDLLKDYLLSGNSCLYFYFLHLTTPYRRCFLVVLRLCVHLRS